MDEGKFEDPAMPALRASAITAFEAVSEYVDNAGALVDSGKPSLETWTELGRLYRDAAEQMENYGLEREDFDPIPQLAIDAYSNAVWERYPNVSKLYWAFGESLLQKAWCLMRMNSYAESRTVYEQIISAVDAGNLEQSRKPKAMREIGGKYQREAEQTAITADTYQTVDSLLTNAMARYAEINTDAVRQLDNGNEAAWAISSAIWAYNNASTSLADARDYFESALSAGESVVADPQARAQYVVRAAMELGWIYIDCGERLGWTHPDFEDKAAFYEAAKFYFDLVLNNSEYGKAGGSRVKDRCNEGLKWMTDRPI